MSAGSVVRAGNRLLDSLSPNKNAAEDIRVALSLGDPPLLQLFYELALECGHSHDEACLRALPIYLQNCAIHLADDIADGDCDYFEKPSEQGTTALYTLQQMVALSLGTLPRTHLQDTYQALITVGFAQHKELKTEQWTIDVAREMTEQLNGKQFEAYFGIVSAGTTRYKSVSSCGFSFGIANHLANDIQSGDERFFALNEEEQEELRYWGLEHAGFALQLDSKALSNVLPTLLRHLR